MEGKTPQAVPHQGTALDEHDENSLFNALSIKAIHKRC